MKKLMTLSNFKNGKFQNITTTSLSLKNNSSLKTIYKFFFAKNKDVYLHKTIQTLLLKKKLLETLTNNDISITWLGYSTTLIKIKK